MPLVLFVFLLLRLTDPFIDRGVGKLSGVEIWLEPCDHLGREQVGQVGQGHPKVFEDVQKLHPPVSGKGGLGGVFFQIDGTHGLFEQRPRAPKCL